MTVRKTLEFTGWIVVVALFMLLVMQAWDRQAAAQQRSMDRYVSTVLMGDDNQDGIIDEDESGWDCHALGNHICGPTNN